MGLALPILVFLLYYGCLEEKSSPVTVPVSTWKGGYGKAHQPRYKIYRSLNEHPLAEHQDSYLHTVAIRPSKPYACDSFCFFTLGLPPPRIAMPYAQAGWSSRKEARNGKSYISPHGKALWAPRVA